MTGFLIETSWFISTPIWLLVVLYNTHLIKMSIYRILHLQSRQSDKIKLITNKQFRLFPPCIACTWLHHTFFWKKCNNQDRSNILILRHQTLLVKLNWSSKLRDNNKRKNSRKLLHFRGSRFTVFSTINSYPLLVTK